MGTGTAPVIRRLGLGRVTLVARATLPIDPDRMDEAAFAAHGEMDHLAAFQEAIDDLPVGEPKLLR